MTYHTYHGRVFDHGHLLGMALWYLRNGNVDGAESALDKSFAIDADCGYIMKPDDVWRRALRARTAIWNAIVMHRHVYARQGMVRVRWRGVGVRLSPMACAAAGALALSAELCRDGRRDEAYVNLRVASALISASEPDVQPRAWSLFGALASICLGLCDDEVSA